MCSVQIKTRIIRNQTEKIYELIKFLDEYYEIKKSDHYYKFNDVSPYCPIMNYSANIYKKHNHDQQNQEEQIIS